MSPRLRRWPWAFALLAPLVAACGSEHEPGARPTVAPAASVVRLWRGLGKWSGRGDRQTESFDVTSGSLRLTWQTAREGAPGAGRFRVSLHSAISGRVIQTIVDVRGAGADTAYIASEPRVAYLLIESDQVDWRVSLEEGVGGASDAEAGRE